MEIRYSMNSWKMNENFILEYEIPLDICDALIEYHKNNKYQKRHTEGRWKLEHKEGVDVCIYPNDQNPVIQNYTNELCRGLDLYNQKYNYKQETVIHEGFNIQWYPPNGGYKIWHCEREFHQTFQRSLVFMTYLNDIPDGGGTEFLYYPDFKVNAKKGLTLIWPTDFTHTHRGVITDKEKWIVTGWFNYPDVEETRRISNVRQKRFMELLNMKETLNGFTNK